MKIEELEDMLRRLESCYSRSKPIFSLMYKMVLPVRITLNRYRQFMSDLNLFLREWIITNTFEYEALGVVVQGLTPRMKTNMYEHMNIEIGNLLNNNHPIILKKLVLTIVQSLDASIIALFKIRPKNLFTPEEIETYLYSHLEFLLDIENHSPSIFGHYIEINLENTLEQRHEIDEHLEDE